MRLNWVVILLAAILLVLVFVFLLDISISEEGERHGAPIGVYS